MTAADYWRLLTLFGLIVLANGSTQQAISWIGSCIIIGWILSAPYRWNDGE